MEMFVHLPGWMAFLVGPRFVQQLEVVVPVCKPVDKFVRGGESSTAQGGYRNHMLFFFLPTVCPTKSRFVTFRLVALFFCGGFECEQKSAYFSGRSHCAY